LRALLESPDAANYDVPTWSRAAYEFHRVLTELAGNRTIALQSAMLEQVIRMHLDAVVSRNADTTVIHRGFERSLKSYAKLVDLIEAGDVEAAGAHWDKHMGVAGDVLLRGIETKAVVDLFY